ncbi:MAG: L-threonylcarbamoyladenylate synthase, partial [Planctomycetales bacterium]|nr:L-threonylcarbamoyladenylate synthase [Planctomycetales bacterium]
MGSKVIDVRSAVDLRDVVHRAVQTLVEGGLVVFPTETVYGLAASALNEHAVQRLLSAKGRSGAAHPLTLAVRSADDALDYMPHASQLCLRLARRCWPGPITLVVDDSHADSLVKQLPASVRAAVVPAGRIGLRVPAHPLVLDVLQMIAGPLALTSANRSGGPDSVTVDEAVET